MAPFDTRLLVAIFLTVIVALPAGIMAFLRLRMFAGAVPTSESGPDRDAAEQWLRQFRRRCWILMSLAILSTALMWILYFVALNPTWGIAPLFILFIHTKFANPSSSTNAHPASPTAKADK